MSFAAVARIACARSTIPYPGLRPFEISGIASVLRPRPADRRAGRAAGAQPLPRGARRVGQRQVVARPRRPHPRAGARPRLEAGRRWRIVVTRPAGAPFETLAADLRTRRSRSVAADAEQSRPDRNRAAASVRRKPAGRGRPVRGALPLQGSPSRRREEARRRHDVVGDGCGRVRPAPARGERAPTAPSSSS